MKAVRVATHAKGRSISVSIPRGSPADTPRPTSRAVSTRAWKPEPQHRVSPEEYPPTPPPQNTALSQEVTELDPSHLADTLAFRSRRRLLWREQQQMRQEKVEGWGVQERDPRSVWAAQAPEPGAG